jgi:hypothetical protein
VTHTLTISIALSPSHQTVTCAIASDAHVGFTCHPAEMLYERLTEQINRQVRAIVNHIERVEMKDPPASLDH